MKALGRGELASGFRVLDVIERQTELACVMLEAAELAAVVVQDGDVRRSSRW
jgi:hypothetical protein